MRRSSIFWQAASLSLFFFTLYALTAARVATGYADSDEILVTGYLFGAAHPPGYSLIVVLTGLWQHLLFWLTPATAGNLLAALLQSLTLGLLALATKRLLSLLSLASHQLLALAPSFLLGFSGLYWFHATRLEVQTFQNFLLVLSFYYMLSYMLDQNIRLKQRSFFISCAAAGLAVSQVQTAILTFPTLALMAWLGSKQTRTQKLTQFLKGFGILCVALLFSALLLFLLNSRKAPVSWRFSQNLNGIVHMLSRRDYAGYFVDEGGSRGAYVAKISSSMFTTQPRYAALLLRHLGPGFLALALLGFVVLYRKNVWAGSLLTLLFICTGPLFAGYMGISSPTADLEYRLGIGILERQLLLAEIILSPTLAFGLLFLGKKLRHPALLTLLVVIIAAAQVINFSPRDWQPYDGLVSIYSRTILEAVAPNAVIICSSDISCYNLFYASLIEHIRPDVTILTKNNLYRKYFLDKNPSLYPFLHQENPYYLTNLITWSTYTRPTYLTNPETYYIEYVGLDGNPFFLIPEGYVFRVSTTLPSIPPKVADAVTKPLLVLPPAKDPWNAGLSDYFANIHNFSGILAAKQNHLDAAKTNFEYALSLKPDYEEPLQWLARLPLLTPEKKYQPDQTPTFVTYTESAKEASSAGNLETSYETIRKATYLDPQNIPARLFMADLLRRGGYRKEALLELQQILVFDPQNQAAKAAISSL